MSKVTLTLDGKTIVADPERTILEVALDNGIYIPHLCSHENLLPAGACRMCVVKVQGVDGVVTACSTKVREGMVVHTHDELAEKIRKLSCDLIVKTHPSECTGCPKYGKCQLQSIIQVVGDTGRKLRTNKIMVPANEKNPVILHEMYRCILCGRCVRACQDMRGVGAIRFDKVKGRLQVVIDGESLNDAACRFCTACVEVCPTGSIREHDEIASKQIGKTRDQGLVPCREGCPAKIDVPRYIRFIKDGNCSAAAAVVREKAPFPHVLGYVCTHPCELECKRNYLNDPISIRNLKRYAAANDNGLWRRKHAVLPPTGKRVAVIGAGPAGLTAAYYLAGKGHGVIVYEANEKAGGQLRYGIPKHRLPRDVIDSELGDILTPNVTLKTNSRIENVPTLLEQGFDAAFVAVGTHQGVKLPIPGAEFASVYLNTSFLRDAELEQAPPVGKRVMVLGGGNVALDCAAVARRLGAEEVHVSCLECYGSMTASEEERAWAEEEGVLLHNSVTFPEIVGENGRVTGVRVQAIHSFSFDENGRTILDIIPDSDEVIPVDSVIFAIGQRPSIPEGFGLELSRGGRIAVKNDCETSVKGVFAAGDGVTGTASVVKAIAGARNATERIDLYLGGDGKIDEMLAPEQYRNPNIGRQENFGCLPRRSGTVMPAEKRCGSFETMDLGLSGEDAAWESNRCLQCDLRLDLAPQRFWASFAGDLTKVSGGLEKVSCKEAGQE
jgi:NADPH-dependent glutamate synthase beta subunit-like oxidoreductase/ferredoxin